MRTAGDGWYALAPLSALPTEGHASFECAGRFVAVYVVQGEYFAIEDLCTHDGEPLADAPVEQDSESDVAMGARGPVVVCPRHGARFCLRSGAVLCPPAYEPITTLALRVADGHLWIRFDAEAQRT